MELDEILKGVIDQLNAFDKGKNVYSMALTAYKIDGAPYTSLCVYKNGGRIFTRESLGLPSTVVHRAIFDLLLGAISTLKLSNEVVEMNIAADKLADIKKILNK